MTVQNGTDRAKAEYNADRAYIRSIDPDHIIPAWSRAPAWRRWPYLRDPDRCRADREAAQRGEQIEVGDE
jgi:hypothetical protein